MNYFIGWDVGAWKCSKGKEDSCDAIVVMDENGILGFHRDNIGGLIRKLYDTCASERPRVLVEQWFALCGEKTKSKGYEQDAHYYIAIDTPLGWPRDFSALLNSQLPTEWSYQTSFANIQNSLLYRYTEREKLKNGLSVIVDSIGSQSAKGMLLLQLLGAKDKEWGVWKTPNITLFETYPKACLVRAEFIQWICSLELKQNLTETFKVQLSKKDERPKKYGAVSIIAEDVFDAAVCACLAKAYAMGSPKLVSPTEDDPQNCKSEGWIFYPDDPEAVADQSIADGHKIATCCESVMTFHDAILAFQKHLMNKAELKTGTRILN